MTPISRRNFLATMLAAGTGAWSVGHAATVTPSPRLRKAMIYGLPDEKTLAALKDAGFDGMECSVWDAAPDKAEAARKLAEKFDLRIHSVMRGWAQFNDPKQFTPHLATVQTALQTAKILGASTILLVPGRISGMPMPKPREFQIEFDPRTGHLQRVVAGDNAPYAAYLKAHNQAVDATRAAFEKLIPAAEKAGVVIAHENVWNNLWVKPDLFANFITSFKSRWLQAYFDIGNHVKYAPPQDWICTLGGNIAKCHVKDFKLNADPGGDGQFVNIRNGSVEWPAVRAALAAIGYTGWLTIEASSLTLAENSRRLDQIIAGK